MFWFLMYDQDVNIALQKVKNALHNTVGSMIFKIPKILNYQGGDTWSQEGNARICRQYELVKQCMD